MALEHQPDPRQGRWTGRSGSDAFGIQLSQAEAEMRGKGEKPLRTAKTAVGGVLYISAGIFRWTKNARRPEALYDRLPRWH